MSIKKAFIISFIIGLLIPLVSHAQIIITEIMYDPAGADTKREWVEVFNSGSVPIDLSTYFLHENNVFHKIVAQGSSFIAPNQYAIIADSVADVLVEYSGYTGLIFDSAFSLSNTGETISISNAAKEHVHTVTYLSDMGANNTGHSLQLNGDVVITASPTFGTENKTESEVIELETSTSSSSSSTGSGSNISTHTQQTTLSNYNQSLPFKIDAGRDRIVTLHTPLMLEAFSSKADVVPSYRWNFGDMETGKGRRVLHTYTATGNYNIVLEGRSEGNLAVARAKVRVVEPLLHMSQSATSTTITNRDKEEVNVGGFELQYLEGSKVIPENTILSAGTSVTFARSLEEILVSIDYPDGHVYQRMEIDGTLLLLLRSYCFSNPGFRVCKSQKVKELFGTIEE